MEKTLKKNSNAYGLVGNSEACPLTISSSDVLPLAILQLSLSQQPRKRIVIPGIPHHQPRHRNGRRKNAPIFYDPAKLAKYHVGLQVREEWGFFMQNGAIGLDFAFVYDPPSSWSKKKKKAAIEGYQLKTSKPDIDNLTKFYLDAMTGIVYEDDHSVVFCNGMKVYGKVPQTIIEISYFS